MVQWGKKGIFTQCFIHADTITAPLPESLGPGVWGQASLANPGIALDFISSNPLFRDGGAEAQRGKEADKRSDESVQPSIPRELPAQCSPHHPQSFPDAWKVSKQNCAKLPSPLLPPLFLLPLSSRLPTIWPEGGDDSTPSTTCPAARAAAVYFLFSVTLLFPFVSFLIFPTSPQLAIK